MTLAMCGWLHLCHYEAGERALTVPLGELINMVLNLENDWRSNYNVGDEAFAPKW